MPETIAYLGWNFQGESTVIEAIYVQNMLMTEMWSMITSSILPLKETVL